MRIPCPYCGARGNGEFSYRGGVPASRPPGDDGAAWHDYVYLRDNAAGTHREYWQHVHGCRAWLVVTRDTRTHAVLGAEPADRRDGQDPPPSLAGGGGGEGANRDAFSTPPAVSLPPPEGEAEQP